MLALTAHTEGLFHIVRATYQGASYARRYDARKLSLADAVSNLTSIALSGNIKA